MFAATLKPALYGGPARFGVREPLNHEPQTQNRT
jgi:hypothetical protein